jgi:hypothetical protein
VSVRLYSISFTIYNLQTPAVVLSREDWLVANLAQDLDDVDVLLSLDLLREIVLTVDGPGRMFTLDF